jgi:hypothetical protein
MLDENAQPRFERRAASHAKVLVCCPTKHTADAGGKSQWRGSKW